MSVADLTTWLDDFTGSSYVWYAKRLSGNDTIANGSHQAGPYIPLSFLFEMFPAINRTDIKNPDIWFDLYIDSHSDHRYVRAVYYNNKFHENPTSGRNEARLTGFGGGSSALLDPESTGALSVFAFELDEGGQAIACHIWVCRHEIEEDLVEDRIGPVEPGNFAIWSTTKQAQMNLFSQRRTARESCWLESDEIPTGWVVQFPTGAEIIRKAVDLRRDAHLDPDNRLMSRRECEFEIFRSLEEAIELPHIKKGFTNIDDFISRAQSILQRRKVRSGRSLELHAREIFIEERLREEVNFSHGTESDPGRRPDFLFPSQAAYRDPSFPVGKLRMLAVKTTCKDRWRQILNEADRISVKHLLTLQEGVSEGQFREMTDASVRLVVPLPLVSSFPKSVRPHLQSLESFIGDIRLLTPQNAI